ncbi:ankyrin repeat domain-containing protein [Endozoicomonas sp.]|uniref:ankyrin repeat domain-containing protein n=1 Tax=Endozoicomonas sp. TaxID=1892382 RepID=UPI00383BB6FE
MNEQEERLITAIKTGNTEQVRQLLASGSAININVQDENSVPSGLTPLHYAIEYGQLDSFNALLKNGADLFIPHADGLTAYTCSQFKAGKRSGNDAFTVIADDSQGQNLSDIISTWTGKVLSDTAQKELASLTQVGEQSGSKRIHSGLHELHELHELRNVFESKLETIPASDLFSCKLPGKVVDALEKMEITPSGILQERFSSALSTYCKNDQTVKDSVPLFDAVKVEDIIRARQLLKSGANPNIQECQPTLGSNTPLYYAGENGSEEMVDLLKEFGANPSISLPDGQNPLSAAAANGYLAVIDQLSCSKTGKVSADAALHRLACFEGDARVAIEIADKLWNLEPNLNVGYSVPEVTPLLMATQHGHPEMADWLIQKGSNVITNTNGYTPLDYAVNGLYAGLTVILLKGYNKSLVRGDADKNVPVNESVSVGSRSDTGTPVSYIASEALKQSLEKFLPRMENSKLIPFLEALKTLIQKDPDNDQNSKEHGVCSSFDACLKNLDDMSQSLKTTENLSKEVSVTNIGTAVSHFLPSIANTNTSVDALPVGQREVAVHGEVAGNNHDGVVVAAPMANVPLGNLFNPGSI